MAQIIEPKSEAIVIQTRKGRRILCEPPRLPMTPEEERYIRREMERWNSGSLTRARIRERRGPSYDYNCHGLTFLSRRAWLADEDAVELVLSDDGYAEVPTGRVLPGDIVVYRDHAHRIEHTGIVVLAGPDGSLTVPWVVSKWGNAGEYIHPFNESLYSGTAHFMREGTDGRQ
jgi:hypothetical protein